MKSLTFLAFLTIGSISTFMPAQATDDKTSTHHFRSVHLTKTHHRAKTTLLPYSTLNIPATTKSSPATAAGPTCTVVPAGSKDTPTTHEPGTSISFRTECGFTDKTVQECPFLCGPGPDGTLKACFPDDVSFLGGNGSHVCKQCLPPCEGDGDKPVTSGKATPTPPPKPSCTSVAPGSKDSPASKDPGTGLLFRATCGITDETVDQCPYLCSQAGGGAFKECFHMDLSGLEPTGQLPPIECTQCLPPCKAGKRFKRD